MNTYGYWYMLTTSGLLSPEDQNRYEGMINSVNQQATDDHMAASTGQANIFDISTMEDWSHTAFTSAGHDWDTFASTGFTNSTLEVTAMASIREIALMDAVYAAAMENGQSIAQEKPARTYLDMSTGFYCGNVPGIGYCKDAQGNDYITFVAGGSGFSAGVAPLGSTAANHLTGLGMTAIFPNGVGFTGSTEGFAPAVGTPGLSASYTVPIKAANTYSDMYNQGKAFFTERNGMGQLLHPLP